MCQVTFIFGGKVTASEGDFPAAEHCANIHFQGVFLVKLDILA